MAKLISQQHYLFRKQQMVNHYIVLFKNLSMVASGFLPKNQQVDVMQHTFTTIFFSHCYILYCNMADVIVGFSFASNIYKTSCLHEGIGETANRGFDYISI